MKDTVKHYKSPERKLFAFFERSRDKWKSRCLAAKKIIKRKSNEIRFLKGSKARWRERAVTLEREVAELKKNLERKRMASQG
jgi:hypothetical protein